MHNLYEQIRDAFARKSLECMNRLASKVLYLMHDNIKEANFYFHPLGFIYTVAHIFENGETIRVHIWDKKFSISQSGLDIHNHYYIVNSYIYCGCVINKIFCEKQELGEEFAIFTGSYSNNGERILSKTGEIINLALEHVDKHCAGMLYSIQTNEIHSGGAFNDELTCTIVFTERPGVPSPLVAGPLDSKAEYRFTKMLVDVPDIKMILQKLLNV